VLVGNVVITYSQRVSKPVPFSSLKFIQANSAFDLSGVDKWVAGLFIGCALRWRYLVNACEVKAHLIGCWQNFGAVCFWQPIPSGLNLVVAVLRGRLLYVVYRV